MIFTKRLFSEQLLLVLFILLASGFLSSCKETTDGSPGGGDVSVVVNKCHNGVVDKGEGEFCDTAIPAGQEGSCKTEADCAAQTTNKCQPVVLEGTGCMAHCVQKEGGNDCGKTEPYELCDTDLQCKGENSICYKGDPAQRGFCTKKCNLGAAGFCGDDHVVECADKGAIAICEKIVCGDGRKSHNEICDTNITAGDGACETEADCKAKGTSKCNPYTLSGSGCQAHCVSQTLPGCNIAKYYPCDSDIQCIGEDSICFKEDPSKEGFCTTVCDRSTPAACGPANAYECVDKGVKAVCMAIKCGDGRKNGREMCDTSIPPGSPGACETEADCQAKTTNKCEPWVLTGTGCMTHCEQRLLSDCGVVDFYGLCDNDLQCRGEGSFCFKPENALQGFCTTECDELGNGCGADQTCIPGPQGKNVCTKSCDSTDPTKGCFRPEYACEDSPTPNQKKQGCFFGLPIGSPCNYNSMCRNGRCLQHDARDSFRDGYCTALAPGEEKCPAGSSKWANLVCLKNCSRSDSQAPNKDCRTPNYQCLEVNTDKDLACYPIRVICTDDAACSVDYKCAQGPDNTNPGHLEAEKRCWKYGFGNKNIGDMCTKLTECGGEKSASGGDFKAVCMYMNNVRDLGMCSRTCDPSDADACSTDSACIGYNYSNSGEHYCFKKCTVGGNECDTATTGRTCQLDAGSGKRVCLPQECTVDSDCDGVLAGLVCQESLGRKVCTKP